MTFKNSNRGAALVIVLFIAAILASVAGLLIVKTKQHVKRISIVKDYLKAERNLQSDLNQFIYNTQTSAFAIMGQSTSGPKYIAELPDDINLRGVPFKYGGSIFKVQDMGGLLQLIPFEPYIITAYLEQKGWSSVRIQRFIDVLADWQDPDSFRRLNGAELGEYRVNGYPLNQNLQTVKDVALLANIDSELADGLIEDKNIVLYSSIRRTLDYVPDELLTVFNTKYDANLILKGRGLSKDADKKEIITDYPTGNWIIEVSTSYNRATSSKMIYLVRRLGERRPYVISRRQEIN